MGYRPTAAVLAACAMLTVSATLADGEDMFALLEPQAYEASRAAVAVPITEPPAAVAAMATDQDDVATALVPAQALELVPPPEPIDGPPAEAVQPVGPAPTTALGRSIQGLTLDATADAELLAQMATIPDEFAIKDAAAERFGEWDAPAAEATLAPPRFYPTAKHFAAPAVYTRPLYFEQPNVERYGHHVAWCEKDHLTQSALSAAHFFATVPLLPYKMGANRPDDCSYVLGSYRPGSCNPHQLVKPELSLPGSVLEGVAVTGLIFLIP